MSARANYGETFVADADRYVLGACFPRPVPAGFPQNINGAPK
jgi:hypothetical protein